MTTDLCTLDNVKSRLASDDFAVDMSDDFDGVITAKCAEVSADIERMIAQERGARGPWHFMADASASARTFYSRGGRVLAIDDCIEITAVSMMGSALVVSTDYVTNDYVPEPISGTPYVALSRINALWPAGVFVTVTAKWGFATANPVDAREAAIIEVIRSYLADRAGNDDRLGLTPFGSVITAKAYTSKVMELVNDYSMGGGFLR